MIASRFLAHATAASRSKKGFISLVLGNAFFKKNTQEIIGADVDLQHVFVREGSFP